MKRAPQKTLDAMGLEALASQALHHAHCSIGATGVTIYRPDGHRAAAFVDDKGLAQVESWHASEVQ